MPMLQKITALKILRRAGLLLCAVFCLLGCVACSENSAPPRSVSDVFAVDVSVVYDGLPHSITIENTLLTDTVLYSTDGVSFSSSSPSFTDVGEYTVYYKVIRSGYSDFYSSATVTILPTVLTGISAPDLSFVYDGIPHYIQLFGVLDSDIVYFSLDGEYFSLLSPQLTEVGVYTVYYRVERSYGEYRDSCTVTIYPNIYGRYFHPSYGVIVLDEYNTDVSGTGLIDGEPFFVEDNILHYRDLSFTLLSDNDYVYRLNVNDSFLFFVSLSFGKLVISFDNDCAVISLVDDIILSLPDYNYCESGVIVNFIPLCFEQEFVYSSDITDITVTLSQRAVNPTTFNDVYVTYDGQPHSFDFSLSVIFLSSETEFTAVGRHTVSVVVLSDEYLPLITDVSLVILPDVSGVFISENNAIQIRDGLFYLNGELCGELSVYEDDWCFDGKKITSTDDGIVYDGEQYVATTDKVILLRVGDVCYVVKIQRDADQVVCTYDGNKLDITLYGDVLLSVSMSGSFSVLLNGSPHSSLSSQNSTLILGIADLAHDVILVEFVSDEPDADDKSFT